MFDQVVFAGGGNRCWWQAGFWDVVQPELKIRPRVITGISAGAATACMLYTRDSTWVMRYYEEALRHNTRNAYWGNLLRRESVFPHYRIYRQALLDIYGEQFATLAQAPEIRIGVSHLPRWLGARSAVAAGLIAYNIEKYVRKTLHPTLGQTLGFHPEFVRAQDCASVEDLADLILQSSSTPPFTPVLRRNGRPVLDGHAALSAAADVRGAARRTAAALCAAVAQGADLGVGLHESFADAARVQPRPGRRRDFSATDTGSARSRRP
jgi:Patatin-like phospholipase